MNTRVMELAKQSGAATCLFDAEGHYFILTPEIEKFAELLIKECVKVTKNSYKIENPMAKMVVKDAARNVTKHFGMK